MKQEVRKFALMIRVTEAEKRDIEGKAKAAGMVEADYIRKVLAQTRLTAKYELKLETK